MIILLKSNSIRSNDKCFEKNNIIGNMIKVTNIPKNVEIRELIEIFQNFGYIIKLNYLWLEYINDSCECVIKFKNKSSVTNILKELDGKKMYNNIIKIERI